MSGITANHAHAPQWKRLSEAAILELDPEKLLERIVVARSAIHDRLGDGFSKPSNAEQVSLRNALEMPRRLRTIAEDEISKHKKTA